MEIKYQALIPALLSAVVASFATDALSFPESNSDKKPIDVNSSTVTRTSTRAVLIPPKLLTSSQIPYPTTATTSEEVTVLVAIDVLPDGQVDRVELLRSAGEPFDSLVRNSSTHFVFQPATYGGVAVPVRIKFSQRFVPPKRVSTLTSTINADKEVEIFESELEGQLRTKGTRVPIAGASIRIKLGQRKFTTVTNDDGRFLIALPPGEAEVRVSAYKHRPFLQKERLSKGKRLSVVYVVERRSYEPYEILVIGKADRTEVSSTVLRGKEIQQIPGTFGDPFRVVNTLPGVTQTMSLLPFPIVRGASPGSTGFLVDGIRVPLLYHLLGGPSVIHPQFVDSLEFMPGGFSVEYGGYTGGIVDGKTRMAREDEVSAEADINLFQSGGMVRSPIFETGVTGTFAGRVGYPGLLLSIADAPINLSYWDYQARLDGGDAQSGWTLFAFGANDKLESVFVDEMTNEEVIETALIFRFHRVDARYVHKSGRWRGSHILSFSYEESAFGPDTSVRAYRVTPRSHLDFAVNEELSLRVGLDSYGMRSDFVSEVMPMSDQEIEPTDLYDIGFLAEAFWMPTPRWLIRPGIRYDLFHNTEDSINGVDPRIMARYQVSESEQPIFLKGSVGIYHQLARLPIPVPGFDSLLFEQGLLEATQSSLGAEFSLGQNFSIDVTGYFNWMDPVVFELAVNANPEDLQTMPPENLAGMAPEETGENTDDQPFLLDPKTGRSYGVELLIRRESREGFFGWISYSLSRSERRVDGDWVAFDFDRTHILNLVAGITLPRNWDLGLRAQWQGGRPLTTTGGFGQARTDNFVRFDVRIDKRAVYRDWLLDFYVDISNVLLGAEEVAAGSNVKYVFPTVGFRAIF